MKRVAASFVLVCAACTTQDDADALPTPAGAGPSPAVDARPSPPEERATRVDRRAAAGSRRPAPWDGSRDVGEAADEAAQAAPTKDPSELMRRLDLHVRAGHDADAVAAMDALRAAEPPFDLSAAASFADTLIHSERDALALRFLERFPEARAGWTYVLLARWAHAAGWQTADRWAAERAPSDAPRWLRERIVLRESFSAAGELFDEIAAIAKAAPADSDGFIAWLDVRQFVSRRPDAAWIAEAAQPALAFDATRLGERLREAKAPATAVVLLDRSLAMPFTAADVDAMRAWSRRRPAGWEVPGTPERCEAVLRRSTRLQLAAALHEAGDAPRAQAVLESLAADAKTTGELPDLFLAGGIQAASGARVVERRVVEAEEEEGDTIEYWSRREQYFRGRGEQQQLLEARTRLLALVDRDLATAAWGVAKDRRSSADRRYFLVIHKERLTDALSGRRAAFDVLRAELATMPASLREAGYLGSRMANHYEEFVDADDPVLWRVLEGRDSWDYHEERLLRRIAESRRGAARDAVWTRAETLAADSPARARALGWVMTNTDAHARAVPLLRAAAAGLTEPKERARAGVTLVVACEGIGDWRAAEAALSVALPALTLREIPKWAAKPALVAARAGAADDAMRLWAAKVNLDRGELSALDAMRKAGLTERLRAFYRALGERDPKAGSVTDRALAALAE